jgi:hypothetical protein
MEQQRTTFVVFSVPQAEAESPKNCSKFVVWKSAMEPR